MSKSKPFLPPDDMPPVEGSEFDGILRRELEQSTTRCFYEACDRITQTLLSMCQWHMTTNFGPLMLIIQCPDMPTFWNIMSDISQLGNRLKRFANRAKIRVCPPPDNGAPFEIRVDEISLYRDWF
jgi:hypothetical protein